MKALVWYGDKELRFEEAPAPNPGAGEVVLEVELAGICGSDLHGYRGHPGPRVPPLVLGHEVVGRVDGILYTVYPLVACGECAHCLAGEDNLCPSWRLIGMHRAGVFAEQVVVPERSLVPLPPGLEPNRAVLAEPLACCVGALAPHDVGSGTTVAVLGCGPLGLLTIYLAARQGALCMPSIRCRNGSRSPAASVHDAEPERRPRVTLRVQATWRRLSRESGGTIVARLGNARTFLASSCVVRSGCAAVRVLAS